MHNNMIIETRNLKYRYPSSRRIDNAEIIFKEILKGLDIDISRGEKVSIIGPNGAGKTTLLLNLAGLLDQKYREGTIKISGIELNDKNIFDIREKIGFVFQDPNDQLFSTTVFDDVAFGLINFLNKKNDLRSKDNKYVSEKVKSALEKVNLFDFEHEVPHFLSFGEKKLAALATVLSYEPEIFILDEPSSNLDPRNREGFITLLKEMKNTVVVATHDLDLAYDFSDRIILINRGVIAYDGKPDIILKDKVFLEKNDMRLPLSLR